MKLVGSLVIMLLLFSIGAIVFGLGYIGYIPVVANFLGTNKPRDLGIRFTEKDRREARTKTGVQFGVLPASTSDEQSIQRFGEHNVDDNWNSVQASALMNDRPWKYWPYKNVQVKFNAGGSTEISGGLNKDVFPNYAAAQGIPKAAVEFIMKLLPPTPVFYLKIEASVKDNQIDVFDPQVLQLNRIPLPIDKLLAFHKASYSLIKPVNAQLSIDMLTDLAKIKNKKDLVISYLNGRLSFFSNSFYASEIRVEENKLIFKGSLPDQEATVR